MSEANFDKFVQWMFDSNGQEEKPKQKDENLIDALGLTKLFAQEETSSTKEAEENPLDAFGLTMKNEMTKLFACFEEATKAAFDDTKNEGCNNGIKLGASKIDAWLDGTHAQHSAKKALAERISAKIAYGQEIPRDISQVETEAETETSQTDTESSASQENDAKMQVGIPKLDAWLADADTKQNARKALCERIAARSRFVKIQVGRSKLDVWLNDADAKQSARKALAKRTAAKS